MLTLPFITDSFSYYSRLIPSTLEDPELVAKYAPRDVDRAVALKEAEEAIQKFMELQDKIVACDMPMGSNGSDE